jgi:hypothetical protein
MLCEYLIINVRIVLHCMVPGEGKHDVTANVYLHITIVGVVIGQFSSTKRIRCSYGWKHASSL